MVFYRVLTQRRRVFSTEAQRLRTKGFLFLFECEGMFGVPCDIGGVALGVCERRLAVIRLLERNFTADFHAFFTDESAFLFVGIRDYEHGEGLTADIDVKSSVADCKDDVWFGWRGGGLGWFGWFGCFLRFWLLGGCLWILLRLF